MLYQTFKYTYENFGQYLAIMMLFGFFSLQFRQNIIRFLILSFAILFQSIIMLLAGFSSGCSLPSHDGECYWFGSGLFVAVFLIVPSALSVGAGMILRYIFKPVQPPKN